MKTLVGAALVMLLLLPRPVTAATALFLDSDPGDFVGAGMRTWRTPADGMFSAVARGNGVSVAFFSAGSTVDDWSLIFAPPTGGAFAPGTYENAQRSASATQPGLDVSGDGRGCNETSGRFVVRVAGLAPNGDPTALAIDFEQHCEGGAPALFGTILFDTGDAACAGQPGGTPCDDGDPCTAADQCVAGTCTGTSACGAETACAIAHCTARDQSCVEFDRVDGTACDDGNADATETVCQAGVCGTPTSTTTTTIPACPSGSRPASTAAPLEREMRFASRRLAVWKAVPEATGATARPQAASSRLRTIPHFADQFTADGLVYPYQMVGMDPRRSHRRTVVPTVVVPLRFVFADGTQFDPRDAVKQLRRSPIFRKSTFGPDETQYGDAVQRAEFWRYTANTRYHVVLGHPSVTKTAVIRVAPSDGQTRVTSRGGIVGLVNEQFFAQRVVPDLVNHMHLPPTKLLVFWSSDVDFVSSNVNGVILGEHSGGQDRSGTTIWTWVWASWHTSATVPDAEAEVAPLSHEIAEWYNNPFGVNKAPSWNAPLYPCNDQLEVGDPLVGVSMVKDGFHLQDEAFLSWFAHEVPSTARDGAYSLFGTLTAPAAGCAELACP